VARLSDEARVAVKSSGKLAGTDEELCEPFRNMEDIIIIINIVTEGLGSIYAGSSLLVVLRIQWSLTSASGAWL
jgi:hypothetical protein